MEPGLQCWGGNDPGDGLPPGYADAYTFHRDNFDAAASHSEITVSGNTITVHTYVHTSTPELFNEFQTWVENAWDKSVTYISSNYDIRINLHRVDFPSVADIIVEKEFARPPPPGSKNNVVCGSHNGRTITIVTNTFCNEASAAAHEFGHELGFEEAYEEQSDGTIVNLHERAQDVMTSQGNSGRGLSWAHFEGEVAMKRMLLCLMIWATIATGSTMSPDQAKDLYDAVIDNDVEMVGEYLHAGGSPDVVISQLNTKNDDVSHWTGPILELALLAARDEIADLLLEAGADATKVRIDDSLIMVATYQGMIATVAQLLDGKPFELTQGAPGNSPLIVASTNGRYGLVQLMLERGQTAGVHWGNRLSLALRQAVGAGNEDVARLLLEAGANPRYEGVIHGAVVSSNVGIVHDLLEAGASVSDRFEGRTPLDYLLIRMNDTEYDGSDLIAEELVSAGADICGFATSVEDLSQDVVDEFERIAPQCDWPDPVIEDRSLP
ncbi:MAG: ankyrin repeat domain-containing protein [Gammaproteobacteria bacterium]